MPRLAALPPAIAREPTPSARSGCTAGAAGAEVTDDPDTVDDAGSGSAAVSGVLNDASLRDELRQTAGGLKSRYSVKAMVDAYVEIIEGL